MYLGLLKVVLSTNEPYQPYLQKKAVRVLSVWKNQSQANNYPERDKGMISMHIGCPTYFMRVHPVAIVGLHICLFQSFQLAA